MKTAIVILSMLVLVSVSPTHSVAQSDDREPVFENLTDTDDGGWLGVTIEDVTPHMRNDLKTSAKEGAVVSSVQENSPAEKAGLRRDDIIVAVNGHPVKDRWDLLKRIRVEKPGSSVTLNIIRNNAKQEVTAVLEESEDHAFHVEPMLGSIDPPLFMISESATQGLRLMDLSDQLAEFFGAPNDKGVLVEEVRHNSPAANAGFKAGDVIVRVGDDPIEDIRDVRNALRHYEDGDSAHVGILRKGSSLSLSLKVGAGGHGRFESRSGRIAPSWHDGTFEWDSHEFQNRMQEFGDRMRKFGKDMEYRMKGLGDRIREQLRHIEI